MFWFTLMLSPTNSPFFFQSDPHAVISNKLAFPSLHCSISNYTWKLWSHKPSHKHDSNKYQSKAFVICDHKSDETRSVTHENKAYLLWLMFRMLSNQHYPHRANQKLRSWANAVFQNRGVCGQAVPSFPSPSPVIPFFALFPTFSTNSRGNACYAGYQQYKPHSYCTS